MTAPITRAGLRQVKGSKIPYWNLWELDPDETYTLFCPPAVLKRAAPTFDNVPLIMDHVPAGMALDSVTPIGRTGPGTRYRDEFLVANITVDPAVRWMQRRQLSVGYTYSIDMIPSFTADGLPYDGIFTGMTGRHVGLVKIGKCGPECSLPTELNR